MVVLRKTEVYLQEIDDHIGEPYPMFDCPLCEKGIVTIGQVAEITFPEGILASERIGTITFRHYTCDRCNFKTLTTDSILMVMLTVIS